MQASLAAPVGVGLGFRVGFLGAAVGAVEHTGTVVRVGGMGGGGAGGGWMVEVSMPAVVGLAAAEAAAAEYL